MPTATTTLTRAVKPRAGTPVHYTAPAVPEDCRGWRRLITGTAPELDGAYGLTGQDLRPLTEYLLPDGALIVECDKQWHDYRINLHRVHRGELKQLNSWAQKTPLGKAVRNYIERRLAPNAARHTAALIGVEANQRDDLCRICLTKVAAGAGQVERPEGRGYQITHLDGDCAPASAIQRPNTAAGRCPRCSGWVASGAGIGEIIDPAAHRRNARYRPAHPLGECPEHPAPGPANNHPGWCTDCGELVEEYAGYAIPPSTTREITDRWQVRHRDGGCPPAREHDTWVIRLKRIEPRLAVGQVARVAIDLRPGGEIPMAPVAPTAVGYRQLDTDYLQIIGVVLVAAWVEGAWQVLVRAASYPEAADVLAAELAAVPDARPEVEGFKARFSVERHGYDKPWLAEITGRHPDFGYARDFLRADQDYTQSNSKGTRGVYHCWTLGPNRYYEACYGRNLCRREFLRTTPEGDVVEIDREQLETWLNAAPVWIAT